jgi:nucleotide-binding universal stress UspA family protein
MYNKIALALAFSPTSLGLLHQACSLKSRLGSRLLLIHIGPDNTEQRSIMEDSIRKANLLPDDYTMIWDTGSPVARIIKICADENVDLLIAGALKKENLFRYYIGSIGRQLIRRAPCSMLILTQPPEKPLDYKNIVIDGTLGTSSRQTIAHGINFACAQEATQVHIFRYSQGFGLNTMLSGEETGEAYAQIKRDIVAREIEEIQKIVDQCNAGDAKINIKIAAGKAAFELHKFASRTEADLLFVQGPKHRLRFIHRLFPHYIEQIANDLPCPLLLDKS